MVPDWRRTIPCDFRFCQLIDGSKTSHLNQILDYLFLGSAQTSVVRILSFPFGRPERGCRDGDHLRILQICWYPFEVGWLFRRWRSRGCSLGGWCQWSCRFHVYIEISSSVRVSWNHLNSMPLYGGRTIDFKECDHRKWNIQTCLYQSRSCLFANRICWFRIEVGFQIDLGVRDHIPDAWCQSSWWSHVYINIVWLLKLYLLYLLVPKPV